MNRMKTQAAPLSTLLCCLFTLATASSSSAEPLEVWVRASQGSLRRLTFDEKEWVVREGQDLQYDATPRRYRGLPLTRILERFGVPQGVDLALLHFVNGMIIPLPLVPSTLERTGAFLALSFWQQPPGESARWSSEFPDIEKRDTGMKDRRPIRFTGNKVVVHSPWHPMVSARRNALFSPWMHADSLSGIELVDSAAYYRQFQVSTTQLSEGGFAIFLGRCQYCHGARTVGASFGWDFVEPIALHTYRTPQSLFLHMRYRSGDAPEKGLMMPAFKDLGPEDARAVWFWLKDLGDRPMPEYLP